MMIMEPMFLLGVCLTASLVQGATIPQSELTFMDTCDEKYTAISKYHSMCLTKIGEAIPVTQQMKDDVINKHNDFRENPNPTAANMMKMYWNDDLALVAERWAQHCKSGHDFGVARKMPNIPVVGQNGAFGHPTFSEAITAWHAEVSDFNYGTSSHSGVVGHYTQVVQAISDIVGCGIANCSGTIHIICNYAHGNKNTTHPYESGEKCEACPDKCSDGLCDCGGKFCYNYGVLDPNTCQCACKPMFTGDRCETKDCTGVARTSWCYSAQFSEEGICDRFSNFPYDCPIKCGTCPEPCNGKQCLNNGELDIAACTCQCFAPFSGDTCENKNCAGVKDPSYCNNDSKCTYSFYKRKCPHMCGYC